MDDHDDLSLRQRVFDTLKKYPNLKPQALLLMFHLPKTKADLIRHYKSQWKRDYRFGQRPRADGLPDSFHKARGWVYVNSLGFDVKPEGGKDVARVINSGWRFSRNRNKALIWKDPKGLGRMEWHWKSGRVNIQPKQPPVATKGRVWQLFCDGFSMTGLIDSMQVLDVVLKSIRLKGATALWDLGVKVPYFVIDFFKLSNGLVLKGGDLSHPTGIEAEFCLPDFQEKAEAQIARNTKIMEEMVRLLRGEQPTEQGQSKLPDFYLR